MGLELKFGINVKITAEIAHASSSNPGKDLNELINSLSDFYVKIKMVYFMKQHETLNLDHLYQHTLEAAIKLC